MQHTMGESCIPTTPQRIAALDIDILGNLLALGIQPIAASSGWDVAEPFPKHLQDKLDDVEYVGTATQPNLEKVLLLKPDLILANSHMESFYDQLSQIAPTVILQHPNLWKQKLLDLAQVLGKEDVADELMNDYWGRINELKQNLGNEQADLQISAATVQSAHGIYAYGARHPTSVVMDDIGLQRPPSQTKDVIYTEQISRESLSEIDGDVLFFIIWSREEDQESFERLQQSPLWRRLNAFQSERVYAVDFDHWYVDHSILAIHAMLDDFFRYLVDTPISNLQKTE
ncbi:MAG: iron-siderophore ABC transporter substrate-binding protein [Cyanobacteria bacterium P01_A01_bin.123]